MRMLGPHVVDRAFRVEVETFGKQCFGGLTVLTLLSEAGGSTDVVCLLRESFWLACAWLTSGFSPKYVKPPLTKMEDSLLDNGSFLFEAFLARRKKKRQFRVSECFGPRVDVIRCAQDVVPKRVLERRHFALRRLWDVTKDWD